MDNHPLNSICPYYSMFPLNFPCDILSRDDSKGTVLDPFCGRGTTTFAAGYFRRKVISTDINPVALAITKAKTSIVSPKEICQLAKKLMANDDIEDVPSDEYWKLAYNCEVLSKLCNIRNGLFRLEGPVADALRGVILGCLHGPLQIDASYLSNQMQRTFSPKPDYAIRYWNKNQLLPPKVDILKVIEKKAIRAYSNPPFDKIDSQVAKVDARQIYKVQEEVSHVITSPPYLGMKSYGPDQWLREWFLGGPNRPSYDSSYQLGVSNYETFVNNLGKVWNSISKIAVQKCKLTIRFGVFGKNSVNPIELIRDSILSSQSPWRLAYARRIDEVKNASSRQANQMGRKQKKSKTSEFEFRYIFN